MAKFIYDENFAMAGPRIEALVNSRFSPEQTDGIAIEITKSNFGRSGLGMAARPVVVNDSMMTSLKGTKEISEKATKDPDNVGVSYRYNPATQRYVGVLTDSLTEGQMFPAWTVGYIGRLFKKPLLQGHALDLCGRASGNNPFADVLSLVAADYNGAAQIGDAGTAQQYLPHNVKVQSGLMTSAVINLKVYFEIEQVERWVAEKSGNPFANELISIKQRYARYCLDLVRNYLAYYGNTDTGTVGLFGSGGVTTYSGDSLKTISTGTSTAKGHAMYEALAGMIADFSLANGNLPDQIRVAMSQQAFNLLNRTAYSESFNGANVMRQLQDNYWSGKDDEQRVKITFFADPFLNATSGDITNPFNNTSSDYIVLTAPTYKDNLGGAPQDMVVAGIPLNEIEYPISPINGNVQHCILSRFAGIFNPVNSAVKAYTGFGIKSGS